MPNSTYQTRVETLAHVLSAVGPLRFTDSETDTRGYAAAAIQVAEQGGWYFIHADDLPAGYSPGDVLRHITSPIIGGSLPEPVAVLGEAPDEMRRRLPTTDPTPSRDQDPFARDPEETTQSDPGPGLAERDARIRVLERITESASRQLSDLHADSGARFQQANELANRIDVNDQALSTITERTDDNEQRTDSIAGTIADRDRRMQSLEQRLNTLEDEVFNEVRSRLQTLETRVYLAPTEAPEDDDARLGGHDTNADTTTYPGTDGRGELG